MSISRRMKFVGAVLVSLVSCFASALDLVGRIVLQGDTQYVADQIRFVGHVKIVTQGYRLSIISEANIEATDVAIHAFEWTQPSPCSHATPLPPAGAAPGNSYQGGDNTTDAAKEAENGRRGGRGTMGTKGYENPCVPPPIGAVTIRATGEISGRFAFALAGHRGGDGGNGGAGGKGGTGQQGGRCTIQYVRGDGGRGGDGGDGGDGGSGGRGGDGGNVEISSGQPSPTLEILALDNRGGRGGLPGESGKPGIPGVGGHSGRGSAYCSHFPPFTAAVGNEGRVGDATRATGPQGNAGTVTIPAGAMASPAAWCEAMYPVTALENSQHLAFWEIAARLFFKGTVVTRYNGKETTSVILPGPEASHALVKLFTTPLERELTSPGKPATLVRQHMRCYPDTQPIPGVSSGYGIEPSCCDTRQDTNSQFRKTPHLSCLDKVSRSDYPVSNNLPMDAAGIGSQFAEYSYSLLGRELGKGTVRAKLADFEKGTVAPGIYLSLLHSQYNWETYNAPLALLRLTPEDLERIVITLGGLCDSVSFLLRNANGAAGSVCAPSGRLRPYGNGVWNLKGKLAAIGISRSNSATDPPKVDPTLVFDYFSQKWAARVPKSQVVLGSRQGVSYFGYEQSQGEVVTSGSSTVCQFVERIASEEDRLYLCNPRGPRVDISELLLATREYLVDPSLAYSLLALLVLMQNGAQYAVN